MDNILNLNDEPQNNRFDEFDEMIIDKHFIKKDKIVKILSKPFEERSAEENNLILSYILDISDIRKKFSADNIEERDYKEIITNSVNTSQYKIVKNIGNMIYNMNEDSHFFYIILKGNVRIFSLQKLVKEMNGHSYYSTLLKYRNRKEIYLLKRTIDENFHNYPVEYNDMKIIDKILIKLNLMKLEADNDPNLDPDYLEYLLKYYGSSLAEFRLETYKDLLRRKNEKTLRINKTLIEQKKEDKIKPILEYNIYDARLHSNKNVNVIQTQLKYISPETCRKYYFFLNETNENVTYYELFEDKMKKANDYFGDLENNKYTQRAVANSQNLELLRFSNDMYKDFIKREKAKIIDSQVSFFLNNFFFEKISKEVFIRYYFPFFENVNYNLDQVIIKENEKVEYIYFIKSGSVKLVSKRCILENYILIDLIKNLLKKSEASDTSGEKDNNKLNIKDYEFKSDIQLLKKELSIKHKKHIITYQMNQALGYECFYFGINYLYTAIAESKEVKVYRLKIKHLIEILKDKGSGGSKHLKKKAENQMRSFLNRFILINNDLMKFYDRKLLYKKNYIQLNPKVKKENREKRKLKNKHENFGIILSEQDETHNINNNISNNIETNSETERKNFIKNLFQKKLIKDKRNTNKNIDEGSKIKSQDFFNIDRRKISYKDFFKEKTFYPIIHDKYKQHKSHEKYENFNSNSSKSFNLKTNYTNAKKEIISNQTNTNLRKDKSKKQFYLSNNYFFSDNNNITNMNNLDQALLKNKKLLSNIFSSLSSYRKISNDEIKKKITPHKMDKFSSLKNFNQIIRKRFAIDKYNLSYKYDFRRDLDNNIKLLKYSIFDHLRTPKSNDEKLTINLKILNNTESKLK